MRRVSDAQEAMDPSAHPCPFWKVLRISSCTLDPDSFDGKARARVGWSITLPGHSASRCARCRLEPVYFLARFVA